MKQTIYFYQGVGLFNKGKIYVSDHEYGQNMMIALDCVPHSTHDIELDIEPLELDYDLARAQLKEQARIAEINELEEKLAKIKGAA